jgi:hypothetical protein
MRSALWWPRGLRLIRLKSRSSLWRTENFVHARKIRFGIFVMLALSTAE